MNAPNPAFDPVAFVTTVLGEMNVCAERAVAAAKSGQAQEALCAIGTMQSLLIGRRDIMKEIAYMVRSKRVNPTLRAAIREAAAPKIAALDHNIRTLHALVRAWEVKAEVLRSVLRTATTTHSVYTNGPRTGVRMVQQTVRHTIAISA